LTSFVGDSFNAQIDLMEKIPDNILVSFDPGRIYAEKRINGLKKILSRTDILLINEAELLIMMDNEHDFVNNPLNFSVPGSNDNGDFSNLKKLLNVFVDMDITTVVVKLGDKGAIASNGSQIIHVPCFDVECVDTTGAGDSFNAGFLYGQINGLSLEKSCKFGNYVASKCVECMGATPGLPLVSEISLKKI